MENGIMIEALDKINQAHTPNELHILEPKLFTDTRGYFFESFNQERFRQQVGEVHFVQDNESKSSFGTIRGLHFQKPPYAQAKLVRCVKGCVLDIAMDLRKDSSTYGQYTTVELSEDNHRQFFIPKGFAHGFIVLSDEAIFQYKCDEYYHPEAEGGVSINSLGIDLKEMLGTPILSDKDLKYPLLKDFDSPF